MNSKLVYNDQSYSTLLNIISNCGSYLKSVKTTPKQVGIYIHRILPGIIDCYEVDIIYGNKVITHSSLEVDIDDLGIY